MCSTTFSGSPVTAFTSRFLARAAISSRKWNTTSDVWAKLAGFRNSRLVAFQRFSRAFSSVSGNSFHVARISVYTPKEVMHEVTRFSYPASFISANCRATTVIMVSSGTMSE